jgi:hypothetical protein
MLVTRQPVPVHRLTLASLKSALKFTSFFVDLLMAARHLGYLFQVAVLCSSTV